MHKNHFLSDTPLIYFSDIENYVREFFQCKWIAYGMMAFESIERQAMLRQNGGVDYEHSKLFPLAFWNNKKVWEYLKLNNIQIPSEYQYSSRSEANPLSNWSLQRMASYYPSDLQKVLKKFP